MMAEYVTAGGALTFPDIRSVVREGSLPAALRTLTVYFRAGAVKVKHGFSFLPVDGNLEPDWAAIVHAIHGREVLA